MKECKGKMKDIIKGYFFYVISVIFNYLLIFILNKMDEFNIIEFNKTTDILLSLLYFPSLSILYSFPFLGGVIVIPFAGSVYYLFKNKSLKNKLFYSITSITFLLILIYFFWWWISKQEFVYL